MSWEFQLLYWLQELHNPIMDGIMVFLSQIGNAGLIWITIGILLLFPKKYRKWGVQMLIAMALTFIVGNLILKNLIHRDRPCWIDESVPLLLKCPNDYSFPSGHTMNGFTAAVVLFLNDKRWGIPALALATAIAFSRLYNFVHFPTDVLAGVVIGCVSALLVVFIARKQEEKRQIQKINNEK